MDRLHIQLEKGQKIFVTSDLHFGHRNILTFCNRPFSDTKEMTEKLVSNWNEVVGKNDVVLDLGDVMWFDGRHEANRVLERLNGKHYIIQGNHDRRETFELSPVIVLESETVLWLEGLPQKKIVEVFLSHHPMLTWPHRERGVPNLFGHLHTRPDMPQEGADKDLKFWPLQYDVGVDNNNYKPVELTVILNKIGYFNSEKKM